MSSSRTAARLGRALAGTLTAVAALVASPRVLSAQATGAVEGSVTAAGGGTPFADVVVRVDGTPLGAVTDSTGRYRIRSLAAGRHTLAVRRIGFAPERRPVTVVAGAATRADFALGEVATIVAPMVVSATRERQRRADASATIDVLDGAEVRRTRAAHPAQLLNRLPGVHVSELAGEGHSLAIRQPITTKPMYLYLEDGVPTRATGFFNHNALYEVNVPQSGGVEVLKGPGTALYGSDAIGGVVNVLSRPAPPTPSAEASLEGGAYGYGRLLATGGLMRGGDGVRADLNLTRSDGWRDGAAYTRESATLRWDHAGTNGLNVKTVLTGSRIDQQDVPPVTEAQLAARSPVNRAPIAFRDVRALRVSAAVEKDAGQSLWSLTPYARYNELALLPNWQLTFNPQLWDTRSSSVGLLAKYRRDFQPLRARLIAGADADLSPGSFVADQIAAPRTGPDSVWASYARTRRSYDYDVTYRALAPYVHAELSPTAKLRLDAGLRYDLSSYDYTTNLPPTDSTERFLKRPASTSVSYRRLSPKLGATYALRSDLSLFGSYRQGFRAPSQGQLFQQNSALSTVGLDPVRVVAYEAGVRGEARRRLVYQLSAYDMRIRDDILTFVTADNLREASNAGETRHRGIEGSVGAALTPRLRLDASYAVSSQRYVTWTPQAARGDQPAVSFAGHRIAQAPRDLGSVLLAYSPAALGGGRVAVEWTKTGRYAMDDQNSRSYGGFDVWNLHASWLPTARTELFLRAVNLLDANYAELASYNGAERNPEERATFMPGSPRSVFAGVRYAVGQR